MRIVVLLIAIAAAGPAGACCVAIVPDTLSFFYMSDAVAEARWDDAGFFVVERVVRGDVRVHDRLPHTPHRCQPLESGQAYLVSRTYFERQPYIAVAEQRDFARLLEYFNRAHAETHETILANVLRWRAGEISLAQFREWIGTVSVSLRSPPDDDVAYELTRQLDMLLFDLSKLSDPTIAEPGLQAFAALAASFPPGTADEFDAKIAAAGDEDARRREEYEDELFEALKKVLEMVAPSPAPPSPVPVTAATP